MRARALVPERTTGQGGESRSILDILGKHSGNRGKNGVGDSFSLPNAAGARTNREARRDQGDHLMSGSLIRLVGTIAIVAAIGGVPDADLSDDDLTERITRRGESVAASRTAQEAFGMLFERHGPSLRAFLSARVGRDDLDDLEQDVWCRVWEHLPALFHGGNFRAWLYRIARNAAIDHLRKRRDDVLEEPDALIDPRSEPPDARITEQGQHDTLQHSIARLDATSRMLLQARLAGEPYADICHRLAIAPAQAHRLFHNVKAQLRRCVQQQSR